MWLRCYVVQGRGLRGGVTLPVWRNRGEMEDAWMKNGTIRFDGIGCIACICYILMHYTIYDCLYYSVLRGTLIPLKVSLVAHLVNVYLLF